MTKTFMVIVNAKKGANVSGSKIQTAVFNTAAHIGDFRNVAVQEVLGAANTEIAQDLYALGRKSGKTWKLLNFFNTEKKAANAVKKSAANYKGCALSGEFAMLAFSPILGVWRVEGKSVKV